MVLKYLRSAIPDHHPIRLLYHKIIAVLAALFYMFPARKMKVIFITGTNGKTTTTNLITSVLHDAGKKVGMISTINFRVNEKVWANTSKQTTFSGFKLQKLIAHMSNSGCEYLVMEVSSHAIAQNRIWGINYDIAVLTNIGKDHIEYHGSFEAYLETKLLMFSNLNIQKRKPSVPKIMILNKQDKQFSMFNKEFADQKVNYGINKGSIHVDNIHLTPSGSKFELIVPNDRVKVDFVLPGKYNIENALAATAVALSQGISLNAIKHSLEHIEVVPGRSEVIDCGQDFTVIVDYAHDPMSLRNIMAVLKENLKGKLIIVFGATGGGRDKSKRKDMGMAADKYADSIILTNDDPYFEDQIAIIENIAKGIDRKEGKGLWKIPSRKEAIFMALNMANKGDIVLIAGKGCEEIMMIRGERVEWDDRRVVRELFEVKANVLKK